MKSDKKSKVSGYVLTNQEIDKILIKDDIASLIQKYQHKVSFYCEHYIRKGLFTKEERSDVIQTINEQLWLKANKIKYQYNEQATVSTYLGTIIKNICLEIYRKNKKNVPLESVENDQILDYSILTKKGVSLNQLVIQEEVNRLHLILKAQTQAIRDKIQFYFKLCCRIPLLEQDVLRYFKSCPEIYLIKMMRDFGGDYQLMPDKELYAKINYYESVLFDKSRTSDSIKKWLKYRAEQLIAQMNKQSNKANYDLESFKILLHYYFLRKK